MGQNVNYLLGNQSQMLGADPELYRQQLIQQEQARIQAMPAQNQLGAQLGNLLGRGLVNVAQDRGFFEVTNPVLQNLTKIQDIYNTSMQQSDPNDPLSLYNNLQKNFADAGLGRQALMAQIEGNKFQQQQLKTQNEQLDLYKKNPDAIFNRLTQLIPKMEAGDQAAIAEHASLSGMLSRTQQNQDLDRRVKEAQIQSDIARSNAAGASGYHYEAAYNRAGMRIGTNVYKDGKLIGTDTGTSGQGAQSGGNKGIVDRVAEAVTGQRDWTKVWDNK